MQFIVSSLQSNRFEVTGRSMCPTLMPGEHLLVKRLSPTARIFERGTLLLLKHPLQPDLLTIKRLVGLPNELVALVNGELSIDRQPHREDYLSSPHVGEHYTWHSGETTVGTTESWIALSCLAPSGFATCPSTDVAGSRGRSIGPWHLSRPTWAAPGRRTDPVRARRRD
jgi:signal peptidase I